VFHEDIDNGFGVVDVVIGVEFQLLEFGVLTDKIFDRIFESFDDLGESCGIGWSLNVEDDFVINAKFLGDRQGILRRSSMVEVVNGDFCHGAELASGAGASSGRVFVGDFFRFAYDSPHEVNFTGMVFSLPSFGWRKTLRSYSVVITNRGRGRRSFPPGSGSERRGVGFECDQRVL